MAISLKEISDLLHISEKSANVYLELLTHAELTEKQIADFSNLHIESVRMGLQELVEKELVIEVENFEKEIVFQASSVMQLEEKVERETEIVQNLKKFIAPVFQKPKTLEIMKYEGWEGIRKVYLEVLEEAIATNEDIYAFESNLYNSNIGDVFLEKYTERRVKHKVRAKVICPYQDADIKYKEESNEKYTSVKLIKDFKIDANINVVGDLVMAFSTDDPRGTLRRNTAEANTWRGIFRKIWEMNG